MNQRVLWLVSWHVYTQGWDGQAMIQRSFIFLSFLMFSLSFLDLLFMYSFSFLSLPSFPGFAVLPDLPVFVILIYSHLISLFNSVFLLP